MIPVYENQANRGKEMPDKYRRNIVHGNSWKNYTSRKLYCISLPPISPEKLGIEIICNQFENRMILILKFICTCTYKIYYDFLSNRWTALHINYILKLSRSQDGQSTQSLTPYFDLDLRFQFFDIFIYSKLYTLEQMVADYITINA